MSASWTPGPLNRAHLLAGQDWADGVGTDFWLFTGDGEQLTSGAGDLLESHGWTTTNLAVAVPTGADFLAVAGIGTPNAFVFGDDTDLLQSPEVFGDYIHGVMSQAFLGRMPTKMVMETFAAFTANAADEDRTGFGLVEAGGAAGVAADHMAWIYTDNTNFILLSGADSDAGAAVDAAYHLFRIEITLGTVDKVEWFIDGVSQGTMDLQENLWPCSSERTPTPLTDWRSAGRTSGTSRAAVVAIVHIDSVSSETNAVKSFDVTVPAHAEGDLLIACITLFGASAYNVAEDEPGWTLIGRSDNDAELCVQKIVYRYASDSEPADYGFTSQWSQKHVGGMSAYRDTVGEAPIDVSAIVNDAIHPSVLATVAGVLCTFATVRSNSSASILPVADGAMNERYSNQKTGANGIRSVYADEQLGGAGATGTRTSLWNSLPAEWISSAFVLTPSGGGGSGSGVRNGHGRRRCVI